MSPGWTPRPPAVGEPACWSWPIPALDDQAPARIVTTHKGWPFRDWIDALVGMHSVDTGPAGARFDAFHAGRCAICGRGAWCTDHCHTTGLTRGWLCRSCNLQEGRAGTPVYQRYRRLHPAAILDYYELYSGPGWIAGWNDANSDEWKIGPRNVTKWPVWSPDDPVEPPRRRSRRSATAGPEEGQLT